MDEHIRRQLTLLEEIPEILFTEDVPHFGKSMRKRDYKTKWEMVNAKYNILHSFHHYQKVVEYEGLEDGWVKAVISNWKWVNAGIELPPIYWNVKDLVAAYMEIQDELRAIYNNKSLIYNPVTPRFFKYKHSFKTKEVIILASKDLDCDCLELLVPTDKTDTIYVRPSIVDRRDKEDRFWKKIDAYSVVGGLRMVDPREGGELTLSEDKKGGITEI